MNSMIDGVHRAPDGTVHLVLSCARPWLSDGSRLLELQDRLNHYADFVRSGELRRMFGAVIEGPVNIDVVFLSSPGGEMKAFVANAAEALRATGIELTTSVARPQ